MAKNKYYSLKAILEREALYNIIIGERSNGKTYSVEEYGLQQFCDGLGQLAIVRRWDTDFKGKRAAVMFDALVANGLVEKYTKGCWENITYKAGRWFLSRQDADGKTVMHEKPFAYAFAISQQEHDKSTSYPEITTVLFDEFLTRGEYLPDEFILFMNTLSTIIRDRNNVKIFMCGNTVNKYAPYFAEMGLSHIKQMKQGDIDVYEYGNSGLRVAVEFSDSPAKRKPSDVYFAFEGNPRLNMITNGAWEIDIYPHCPCKFLPKEILFKYFIMFNGETLQCEIVQHGEMYFTFIHRKTTPIQNEDKDHVYSQKYDPRPNWHRRINKPITKLEKKIATFYAKDKVFYQDNEVGEIVRNFLMSS